MSISKVLSILVILLLTVILLFNWPKREKETVITFENEMERVVLPTDHVIEEITSAAIAEDVVSPCIETLAPNFSQPQPVLESISNDNDLPPDIDRMAQLFQPQGPLLPIVETICYACRAPWLSGRSAYLGDYAAHYQTSKHFISRSLNGVGNYLSDVVSKGDRFNVFRDDKEIEFHLVLDLSRLKLWLYYYDLKEDSRCLLKSYRVCAGKLDTQYVSGSLTPTGIFALGSEVAIYKEGAMGTFRNELCEMVTVFGKRWIPFSREIAKCSDSYKGIGFHGVPWRHLPSGELVECRECIGSYESSGCIRLLSEDIDEIFAVIISKPSYVHIVKDFSEANLPGKCEI